MSLNNGATPTGPNRSSLKLEEFLDSVLRRDLQEALRKRDDCYNAASHCYHLRQLLADMSDLDEVRKLSIDSLTGSNQKDKKRSVNRVQQQQEQSEASVGTEATIATSKVMASPLLRNAYEQQQREQDVPEVPLRGTGVLDSSAAAAVGGHSGSVTSAPDAVEHTKMLLDLGCHFFTEAEIPNPAVILINVGCGIVCPMSHEEAKKFLVKKEKAMRDHSVALSKEVLRVRFRMRLVMEAINRLDRPQ